MYHGIPRSVVEKFVSFCSSCQLRKRQLTTAPLHPIVACGFLSQLQVHVRSAFLPLIPSSNTVVFLYLPMLCGRSIWLTCDIFLMASTSGSCIALNTAWSKFNFAYAIESKHAISVANALNTHLFPYFGVPRILHSDNGREFMNQVWILFIFIKHLMCIMNHIST